VNLFRAIALVLAAALANPLCCCLGVGESDASPAADANACCKPGPAEAELPGDAPADHDACPHRDSKQSQIADAHSGHAHAKPMLLLASLAPRDIALAPSLREDPFARFAASPPRAAASHAGRRASQLYCVYLI